MVSSSPAAIITWVGGSGTGDWGDPNNWSNNSAWNSANTANFDTDLANGQYVLSLGANRTVAGITFSSGAAIQGFTFNAGFSITSNGAITNNDNDTQTFNNAMALGANQTWSATSGNLTFNGNVANSTRLLTLSAASGKTGTIAGVIGNGSGGITKNGVGTWVLSGANTYTGATRINAGVLSVGTIANGGVASGLGASTNAANRLLLAGGTLRYTGNTASSNRNFTLVGGTTSAIEVTNAGTNLTISGASTATTGGYTKTGAGTLTMSGTNQYTGVTTINAGTLSVATIGNGGVAGNLGKASSAANRLVLGGGTLQYTGSTASTNRNFTLTAGTTSSIDVSNAATNLTVSGSSTATTGGLTKVGAGTLTLSGTNLYSGTTTVNAGTLLANGSASLGDTTGNVTVSAGTLALAGGAAIDATNPTSAVTITKTGMLTLSGSGASASTGALHAAGSTGQTSQWLGDITLAGNATISAADNLLIVGDGSTFANTLNLGANTLTFNTTSSTGVTPIYVPFPSYLLDSSNIEVNSTISGSGGIVKTGAGTLNLISDSANSYTGSTVITGGKLIIDGWGNAPVISSSSVTVGNATGAGPPNSVVLQMGQLASPPAPSNMIGTYDNVLNIASASMTIYADGVFNMNGGSNALANLTLQGGHVDGGDPLSIYSPVLTITGGVTSNASSQTALINNGHLGMSANSFAFNVAKGTASTDLQIDSIVENGIGFTAANTGTSLAKTGAGTLVLTGANTYQGVTDVQAGVLNIQNNSALGQVGTYSGDLANGTTVQAGAQLQLDGGSGGGSLSIGSETLTLNGNGTSVTGELRNVRGNNAYNGFISLGGDSRINADAGTTLTIGATPGASSTLINGTAAGRTLTVGGGGNTTVNAVIGSNVGTVVKDGSGTLTLSGQYSSNATTTVKDGTLALNMTNGLTAAGASVNVGDGIGAANSAVLLLQQSNQIADTAAVTLNADGRLNLNSKNDTVGSIAGSGNIIFGTGQLTTGANNTSTTFSGHIAGATGSLFTKTGAGTLTISSNVNAAPGDFAGNLNLDAGTLALASAVNTFSNSTLTIAAGATLKLTDATLNIANLNLTGNGTITLDFSGTASILNVTNTLTIASGITVNVINWQNAADYFYAANWTGAVVDFRGAAPMNQVVFDSPTWVGNDTKWQSYDRQITPVPEPGTYGAMLLAASSLLLGYRRFRRSEAFAG